MSNIRSDRQQFCLAQKNLEVLNFTGTITPGRKMSTPHMGGDIFCVAIRWEWKLKCGRFRMLLCFSTKVNQTAKTALISDKSNFSKLEQYHNNNTRRDSDFWRRRKIGTNDTAISSHTTPHTVTCLVPTDRPIIQKWALLGIETFTQAVRLWRCVKVALTFHNYFQFYGANRQGSFALQTVHKNTCRFHWPTISGPISQT